jgi:hypothetical protein
MRYDTLAELFYGSSFHQAFNATLRVTAHKNSLLIAAEHDAAAFLIRCPSDWIVPRSIELARNIAADFLDRWPAPTTL